MRTWVVLNDLQLPWGDTPVINSVLNFVDDLKPYGVALNGDIVDCYQLSTFDKDPLKTEGLADEISQAVALMERLAKSTKERHWIGGNHEDRLRRYLWKNAPALKLDANAEFERVFHLREHGFTWRPYGAHLNLGKLVVTHGFIVRQHAAYSAKAHFDKLGNSVMIGHTHRMGYSSFTNLNGEHGAWENGCLCRLDPEYAQYPNWQQGFSVVEVDDEDGFFHVQPIQILGRSSFWYGKQRYRVRGK